LKNKIPKQGVNFNNNLVKDPQLIAENFNERFCNTIPKLLAAQFKSPTQMALPVPSSPTKTNKAIHDMKLTLTNEEEIIKTIHYLRKDAAPGLDKIPVFIMQSCAKRISVPLVHVINLCFKSGHFPSRLKVARVTPIPKKEM
jgi:hypothetical protein